MSMARKYRRHLAWERYERRMEGIRGAKCWFWGATNAWNSYNQVWAARRVAEYKRGYVQKGEARAKAAA